MQWIKTGQRFVAFFDIMGFKDLVINTPHNKVLAKMNNFQRIVKQIENDAQKKMIKSTLNNKGDIYKQTLDAIARPVIFSDSILIITNHNSVGDAYKIGFITNWILNECFEKGIAIKGGLSYGRFTADFDRSIYFGKPLIDAYLLQEELSLYGAVYDHNFENYLHEQNIINNALWVEHKTPLKSGKVKHLLSNWIVKKENNTDCIQLVKNFYKTVSGRPRTYVDNTIEFTELLLKIEKKN